MEPRDIAEAAPFIGYVMQVEAASMRLYADFSRCTRGFEEWIIEACRNPYEGVSSLPPRHVSDSSQHSYIGLESILERLRLVRREAPRTEAAGDEREETCESPTKKARMSPEASPQQRAPVASPCRNAARLGPVPKDPPPRNLFAKEPAEEEPERELSSPRKRLRDRPTPPSQTMPTISSELSTSLGTNGERSWQHKALFNPPPAATTKPKVATTSGKLGLFGQPITSTSSSSPAQRTASANRTAPPVGSSVVAQNDPSSVADMVKRIEGSAPTQDTPVSVFDRIRIFEGTKSSPSLRQPGSTSTVMPSPALGGGRPGSNGTSTTTANANFSSTSASGSSLGAPVKPKELFRNPSESAFRATGTASSSSLFAPSLSKSASTASVDYHHTILKEASTQKAAPISSDIGTTSAPASLFSEKKTAPEHSDVKMAGEATRKDDMGRKDEPRKNEETTRAEQAVPASKKKAHRRSAVCFDGDMEKNSEIPQSTDIAVASNDPPSANTEGASEPSSTIATQPSVAPTTTTTSIASMQQRVRPAVPLFNEEPVPPQQRVEPCMELRQICIPEKKPEDNYEISEHGGDSDAEDSQTKDRSGKHVPKWCETYLETLSRQTDIDPDTIFGPRVPRCVLDDIFTDEMYKQAGKNRPKRARGSSGDWRKDQLARKEISDYKSRMGHARSWRAEAAS